MAGENDHEGDSYNIGVNVLLFVDVVYDTTRERATEHVDRDDSDGHVDHKTKQASNADGLHSCSDRLIWTQRIVGWEEIYLVGIS